MAIFVFVLALILAAGGGGALLASIDLLPTEIGVLYATCGVIALSAACIVASVGAVIVRIDRIGAHMKRDLAYDYTPEAAHVSETHVLPESAREPAASESGPSHFGEESEDAVNENRAGHLPTIEEWEETIAHPEAPPVLVGRYSAGGANYMIFSDGAIEAETEEGQFRFASMGDFKSFMKQRKGTA
jgi:hypothetical protein